MAFLLFSLVYVPSILTIILREPISLPQPAPAVSTKADQAIWKYILFSLLVESSPK